MDISRTGLFVVGWLSYAVLFFMRKPLTLIKADLDFENEYSVVQLGFIDLAFLLPFAIGQMMLGYLADRRNSRELLSEALIISALPLTLIFSYYNNFGIYSVMLVILGLCQSPCWSMIARSLTLSSSSEYRNTVLGILMSASYIGGIGGTLVTVYTQYTYGWNYVYIFPGILTFLVGIAAYFLFKDQNDLERTASGMVSANRYSMVSPSIASVKEYCSNRHILLISCSIFIVRLVRFTMYMWVPYFLLDEILYAQLDSGLISIAFEGGGVLGSLIFGVLLDKIFMKRAVILVLVCNILTAVGIKCFHYYCYHIVHAIVWLAVIGFFNCGADSLLSGSIANEIGEMFGAPGSIVGFINGVGAFGAVLEGPLFSILLLLGGWDTAFLLCIILSAAVSTIPLIFYPGLCATVPHSSPRPLLSR